MIKIITFLVFSLCIISCKSTKNADPAEQAATSVTQNTKGKIIVQLKEHIEPKALEVEFTQYSLKKRSFASRTQNSYLFEFDPDSISANRLIKKINKFDGVILASKLEKKMGPNRTIESGTKKTVTLKAKQ